MTTDPRATERTAAEQAVYEAMTAVCRADPVDAWQEVDIVVGSLREQGFAIHKSGRDDWCGW